MDSMTVDMWLASLAAKTPTPGGGAVAALAAAVAAAQLGMVAQYTTGPKWQDREAQMQKLIEETTALWTESLSCVQADADAFSAVGDAYKLPKESDEDKTKRNEAIQTALTGAAGPPRQVAKLAARVVLIAHELVEAANPNIISDVAVAGSMAQAALESAIVNMQINEREITDESQKHELQAAIALAEQQAQKASQVVKAVRDKIGNQ